MGTIIFAIIFLLVCGLAIVAWEILPFVLIGVVVGIIAYRIILKIYEKKVVETEIIHEEPIIKRQAENTGYSIGYGKNLSYREYYKYRDVQVGEKVKFKVVWDNGNITTEVCNRGDAMFKRLYRKLRK